MLRMAWLIHQCHEQANGPLAGDPACATETDCVCFRLLVELDLTAKPHTLITYSLPRLLVSNSPHVTALLL